MTKNWWCKYMNVIIKCACSCAFFETHDPKTYILIGQCCFFFFFEQKNQHTQQKKKKKKTNKNWCFVAGSVKEFIVIHCFIFKSLLLQKNNEFSLDLGLNWALYVSVFWHVREQQWASGVGETEVEQQLLQNRDSLTGRPTAEPQGHTESC